MFLLCQRFSSFFNLRRLEGAWATHDLESTHISATSLGHNPSQVTLSLLVYQSEQQHSYLIAGDWENKSTKMDMLRYYSDSLNGFWENILKLLSDLCKAYLNSSSLSLSAHCLATRRCSFLSYFPPYHIPPIIISSKGIRIKWCCWRIKKPYLRQKEDMGWEKAQMGQAEPEFEHLI